MHIKLLAQYRTYSRQSVKHYDFSISLLIFCFGFAEGLQLTSLLIVRWKYIRDYLLGKAHTLSVIFVVIIVLGTVAKHIGAFSLSGETGLICETTSNLVRWCILLNQVKYMCKTAWSETLLYLCSERRKTRARNGRFGWVIHVPEMS